MERKAGSRPNFSQLDGEGGIVKSESEDGRNNATSLTSLSTPSPPTPTTTASASSTTAEPPPAAGSRPAGGFDYYSLAYTDSD